ncbi:MAG TPA: choice-of-anchor tandem repeat NxxGxxAF-containing protein, partial [Acidimicrobiales bacterium]|nr:choice-of-anchor tandem repeat NxxGxxAF-containing protein [Acidimicrobiales bacterium]
SYLRETDPRAASSPFRVAAETNWAFEAGDLNDRGEVSYSRYVDEGERLYVTRMGERTELARSGRPAPGGGTYGPGVLGRVDLDSAGNAAFAFALDPLAFPIGRNAGVFRYDRAKGRTDAVVLPGVTQVPGGSGAFSGASRAVGNDRGDVAFGGIVETELGALGSPFGSGVYLAPAGGGPVRAIAAPGDPAPGGGVFDFAANPSMNGRGDVAFEGNRSTEPCLTDISPAAVLLCRSGVYMRPAQTGEVRRLAGQGDQVRGGTLLAAYGPMVNGKGDVVFAGDLEPAPELGTRAGIFLATPGGGIVPVVRPGDPMPGGGRAVSAGTGPPSFSVNDAGDVAFVVTLDTHEGDGLGADMGVYLWSQGQVRLVARTGTVAPAIGTITSLTTPALDGLGLAAAIVNNRGEVLFQATLHDHRVVLVVATGGAVDPCVDALDPEGEHLDGNGSLVFTEDDVLLQARFRGSLCRKAPADRFFAPLLSELDEREPQYVGATLRFDPAMGDADLKLLACEGDALVCTTPLVPDEVSAGPGARSLRWTNTTGAAQVVAVDVALAGGGDPALPYVLELFVNLPQPVFPPPGPPPS